MAHVVIRNAFLTPPTISLGAMWTSKQCSGNGISESARGYLEMKVLQTFKD